LQYITTMDFKDQIKQIGDRAQKLRDQIQTEEATKNALIMPFLQALGYDIFNPLEVVPEFISDVGLKKGEKIDYAIMKDGAAVMLIECKHWSKNLDLHDGQLLRYFHVSQSRFGVLTNGIVYRFYSDLAEPNKMDEKPFLEFSITDLKDNHLEELKKFHKSYFNIENIVNIASELKFMNELRLLISAELTAPSENFVRHFDKQVYPGMITAKVLEQFTNLTRRTIQQYITDIITERLKTALNKENEAVQTEQSAIAEVQSEKTKINTTAEELEAYLIVKSILRISVDPARIHYRDAQSYFSILLDDNNRKPLCRLYLEGEKKQISLLDAQKKETKYELKTLNDIYLFSEQLISAVVQFETSRDSGAEPGTGEQR
jgi:predicted type IV restriction endonuclease